MEFEKFEKLTISRRLDYYRRSLDEKSRNSQISPLWPFIVLGLLFVVFGVIGICIEMMMIPVICGVCLLGILKCFCRVSLDNRKARAVAATITPKDRLWITIFEKLNSLNGEIDAYDGLVIEAKNNPFGVNETFLKRLSDDLFVRQVDFIAMLATEEANFDVDLTDYKLLEDYLKKYPQWQQILSTK